MNTQKDMDRIAFGKRLNAIRREQQISSEQLSELCDINAVFIRQIEHAARLCSLPVFVRLCNRLKVSPNLLLSDSLIWNEDDKIDALSNRLRGLSPRQLDTVLTTANTLIDKLSELE